MITVCLTTNGIRVEWSWQGFAENMALMKENVKQVGRSQSSNPHCYYYYCELLTPGSDLIFFLFVVYCVCEIMIVSPTRFSWMGALTP
jgi:hypothetical protein